MNPVLAGAEPYSSAGDVSRTGRGGRPDGVLVSHGFTGNPSSMRALAETFAAAGFAVELPRLPGHGTHLDDMLKTSWTDWAKEIEVAYQRLRDRVDRVVVCGLSMGATLMAWCASRHPEVVGLVSVNGLYDPAAAELVPVLREMIDGGTTVIPSIGSDIAKPDVAESSYNGTPVAGLISLFEAVQALHPTLAQIRCPVLAFVSPQDHVVQPNSTDVLEAAVGGPFERITLERSFHVATLDYDAPIIERHALAFVERVTAS